MLKLYTIFDKKMLQHTSPVFVTNIVQINRDLSKVKSNPESTLAQFPTDYELYYLGQWDDKTGLFDLLDKPQFEINISEIGAKDE